MGKYVFIYTGGGMAPTEEEQQKAMAAWGAWFGGLGDKIVDSGAPFGASGAVNGSAKTGATGYSIVTAGSLDDAVGLAGDCPIIGNGGNVEVFEAIEM
jgi:hypothetical protein